MYLLGEINRGGFIMLPDFPRTMLHRETRGLHHRVGSPTLREAKERRKLHVPGTYNGVAACPLIVKLTNEGGAERLYARAEDREEVTELLQIWKGCYGAWPVQFLRH